MTLLFTSLPLDSATKQRWCVIKLNRPHTSDHLSPAIVAEHQAVQPLQALLKLHELYAQLPSNGLPSPSLETPVDQRRTVDESGDKKVKARAPASTRAKRRQ
jgi:hypothetical protein